MCCVVKQTVLLLLLAAIGCNAAPAADECEGLHKTLPAKDLHTIFGDWVLVWSVSDHQQGWDLLQNLSSSHVELRLLPDNTTIMFNERNMFIDGSCTNFIINMSMPSDPTSDEHHQLKVIAATLEKDGVVQPHNDSGVVDVYESCPDCLTAVCKGIGIHSRYLLSYRREGHHSDVEQLKAAHSDHRKQAECLGFPHDKAFSYDGAADFCHKKSSPEAKQEES